MIQLQNNFTTPEQSKRLLDLGLPADSADCYYISYGAVYVIPNGGYDDKYIFLHEVGYTPCWSVGRLIEIWCLLGGRNGCFTIHNGDRATTELVSAFESCHLQMDFSKLEE